MFKMFVKLQVEFGKRSKALKGRCYVLKSFKAFFFTIFRLLKLFFFQIFM